MGVYIPGMEMPKPGRYEAVIIVLDNSTAEIAISPSEDDIGYWKEYPLVSVPEHGRLVDADALMANAEYKGRYDILTAYDVVAAPTIIPADGKDTDVPTKEEGE